MESFGTSRILAEKLLAEDLDDLYRMHQDPVVMRYIGGLRSRAETLDYINENLSHWDKYGYGLWVLRDISNKKFMGRGVIRHIIVEGNKEVELGYALIQKYWGQGLASEFVIKASNIAFSELGLNELVILTIPDNHASKRVIEKTGATYERNVIYKESMCDLYRLFPE